MKLAWKLSFVLIVLLMTGCATKHIKLDLQGRIHSPLPNHISIKLEIERKI